VFGRVRGSGRPVLRSILEALIAGRDRAAVRARLHEEILVVEVLFLFLNVLFFLPRNPILLLRVCVVRAVRRVQRMCAACRWCWASNRGE
ncbi:MAG: hypothetical protein N3A54_07480, partial [Patescibacteria group bacterium]|nr:hypothetical protein [Patescibacteria group bacterium]